jgi:copper homeostasis protein
MKLEICANSFQSALNAQQAGAHRIELCSELSIGGMTPSYGLIKKVVEELSIETVALIRPRSGNFVYSDSEFQVLKNDIRICKQLGVDGIVSGVLNADNTIDMERTKELVELSKPLQFTFHRAFDVVPNPKKALQELIELGVHRVLTSGQKLKAIDGLVLLKELKELGASSITILVGSGVNTENAKVFKDAGFSELHASASKVINNKTSEFFGNTTQTVSDVETIRAMLKVLQDEV